MSVVEQYTYWSLTINNPDDNDMLIVRNPNDKYVREFIWTSEKGAEGTEHIQAWLRLQRNQTMKFVQKLYPRAHFKPIKKDEYNENTHNYAQKNDETTVGKHTLRLNDPNVDIEVVFNRFFEEAAKCSSYKDEADFWRYGSLKDVSSVLVKSELVRQYGVSYAKVFTSPSWERIWEQFASEIFVHYKHKHLDGIR